MSRHGYDKMSVNGLSVAVHHPISNPNRGKSLAPSDLHFTHKVAEYKEVPEKWPQAAANEGSFFFGVSPDREYWFDFRGMNHHSHFVAVVISVQRVNAVSGRKVDDIHLEQYKNNCPKHDVPFEGDRYCPMCSYKWPAQNYVTNAAGAKSQSEFWLDGWRSQEGEIRQFVFTDVEAGLGVAQQLIGEERSVAIGFAIYLSKEPKPVVLHPEVLRRSASLFMSAPVTHNASTLGHKRMGSMSGSKSVHPSYGNLEAFGGDDQVFGSNPADPADVAMSLNSADRGMNLESAPVPQIGTPVQQEVSHGRAVEQQVHQDPNDLSFWQDLPAAVIMLTPAPNDWVFTVTRNGPTVDLTKGGLGFLDGVQGVETQKAG